MIINTPSLDYWRATTSDYQRYREIVEELLPNKEEERDMWRFQQYKGEQLDGIAHGFAEQNGEDSYIVDVSGENADNKRLILGYSDMKLTRLDIQYTIKKPDYWDTIEFYYQMELGVWPNAKRHVEARINEGNDTIYIGDRTSERFIRVYVKETDYVRFEVEFKKTLAVKAWRAIRNGGRSVMAGILLSEISRLPQSNFLDELVKELHPWSGGAAVDMTVQRVKSTDIKRVKWLASLLPTIKRMMYDSDYGYMVTGWFVDLVDERVRK